MIEYREKLNTKINSELKYLINVPNDYDNKDNKKWPLMIFLHGAGERGDDLVSIKKYGIHRYLDDKELPFIIVSPQCPEDTFWDIHIKELKVLVEDIKERLRVDHRKIYLVGISMGAYCAWNLSMQYPKLFSAIIPIAGGAMLPKYAYRIKDIPIWAIHGTKDKIVPVEESRKIVNRLKELGSKVKYTEYSNSGHELCTTVFENDELYEWLLQQVTK